MIVATRKVTLGLLFAIPSTLLAQSRMLEEPLPPPRIVTSLELANDGKAAAPIEIADEGSPTPADMGESIGTHTEHPIISAAEKEAMLTGECCPADPSSTGPNMPAKARNFPLLARFGNGFEVHTEDEEFSLQIHNLTQFDYRDYGEDFGPFDPQATFVFPREWLIMNGKLTKPIDYFISFAFGFNSVNVLDVYFNWHVIDDKLQIRLGRYKTPFTYEFYALPIFGLVNPERSLFFNNFGLNRDLGAMALGTIFDKHFDYAFGVFNGTRNGFVDENNDNKDFVGYLNYKPFINDKDSIFQNLNVGGSTDVGNQEDVIASPRTLRTVVPITGVNTLGVPFFNFAANVRDFGPRSLWSAHAAWYHESLSLIGEWQSGFQDYARVNSTLRTNVPINSFYVQAGYFLTGETVTGRGVVQPLRPFDIRKGKRGPGAWEPFIRYNDLNIDPAILSLSDGRPWTNNIQTLNCGTNWYWNPNIKFVLEWERTWFGDEVFITNSATQKSNDGILFRTQIYF